MKREAFNEALGMMSQQSRWIVATKIYEGSTQHDVLIGMVRVTPLGTALFIREKMKGEWTDLEGLCGELLYNTVRKCWVLDVLEPNSRVYSLFIDESLKHPDFPGHVSIEMGASQTDGHKDLYISAGRWDDLKKWLKTYVMKHSS